MKVQTDEENGWPSDVEFTGDVSRAIGGGRTLEEMLVFDSGKKFGCFGIGTEVVSIDAHSEVAGLN
jgi:hypothetical protein